VRLARLAQGLDAARLTPHLDAARAALSTLDAIEAEVRANEPAAVARAIELARSVEVALRALLAEVEP
jgi:AmiR/NasT family two-component response regulator